MKKNNGFSNPDDGIQNEGIQNEQSVETVQDTSDSTPVKKGKKGKNSLADKHVIIDGQADAEENLPLEDNATIDPDIETIQEEKNEENSVSVKKIKKIKKPWSKKKKIIASCILGVIFLIIAGVGIYIVNLFNNPLSAFDDLAKQASNMPSQSQVPSETQSSSSDSPSPSKDPYEDLAAQADNSILKDMVNIILIGVDHSVERDTKHWDFKDFHSDVMIVLSINKVTKEVNMISLPRDTWAQIPGVKGIYKINASIDCGGGWPTEGGFNKVCETAEWMLGGKIPVDYYYAVDMNAVKGLVDSIGGVDYNVDLDFTIMGRSYKEGQQHMNGQAVLDYLRVRKGLPRDEAGDLNRIDRQKKMLVAIFDKLKQSNLLAQIPAILDAFNGNLYTNVNFAQTAALAVFMKDLDVAQIKMNAMGGHYDNLFNWNFVFTDQKKRVDLIKNIYGITVKQESKYTHEAAQKKWAEMYMPFFIEKAQGLLTPAKAKLDADATLPEYVPPTDGSAVPATTPAGFKQYGADVHALYYKANNEITALITLTGEAALTSIDQIKKDIVALCKKVGISIKDNYWDYKWEIDKTINEITVNFN